MKSLSFHLGDDEVRNLFGLAEALKPDLSPPIKALFVYNCNPVTASADQEGLVRGLKREDLFTIVSEIFPTDTTDYADIILPATSQLEQLDLMYSWGHFNMQINNPAIPPRGEAVSNTELFRRLARRMGLDDPALQRSDETLTREAVDWEAENVAGIDLDRLERDGYARLNVGAPNERRPHAEGNFPTPSGKCELASAVAHEGGRLLEVYRQGYSGSDTGGAVDPLPGYRPEAQAEKEPFVLVSPKTHHFLNSGYANMTTKPEGFAEQRVWVHPEDAQRKGISDGDPVCVFNDQGAVEAKAFITDDTLAGVLVITRGFWRKHVGGATVNSLVRHRPAEIGQAPTINETRVDICAVSTPGPWIR
ncbi:molybdopterin-containing oxidoreductase family protein [Dichotomicrobium thermohalophilum]|uniref:molybdopterin-containing oxidoreductase family protein n=1 Tax=Dichotomicrobium thermohalophilum TaxID=933063 RepID=UPI0014744442|nr:molybdopterin-dependent oxidoreductase [Dichotomicrobium thermohalophilum]